MDLFIHFFRDILDGPLYIIVVILNSILICSCIGYLGERYLNKKKAQAKFNETYVKISDPTKQKEVSKAVGTTVGSASNVMMSSVNSKSNQTK